MSGIEIKLRGTSKPDGSLDVSFDLMSANVPLPQVAEQPWLVVPSDPAIDAFGQMVSNPDIDTLVVTTAGSTLYDAIKSHQHAQHILTTAIHAPITSPTREIMVHVPGYANDIRKLPWEVLYDPAHGFLDHDSNLPVIRTIDTPSRATQPVASLPENGLQILSVIAAESIDGLPEYKALRRALESYDKPWTLSVFSPNQSVQQAIADEGAAHIQHMPVPSTSAQLMRQIKELKPQVCHFFCHGVATADGTTSLELETRASTMGDKTVKVAPGDLSGALPSSAWLVLLNACSSGATPSDSSSLAAKLVEEGVPIVVGMREPTTSDTLRAFTQSFMADALIEISQVIDKNAPTVLRLGPALSTARGAICAAYRRHSGEPAKRIKDWSFPVMMISTRPFEIEPGTQNNALAIAKLRAKRSTLTEFLDRLAATMSPAEAQAIEAEIALISGQIQTLLT